MSNMASRGVALLFVCALLGGCQSSANGSSDSGGGSSSGGASGGDAGSAAGGSSRGVSQPAPAKGSCTVVHPSIQNLGGLVTATVDWSCDGPAVLTLRLRLAFEGNNAAREDEGVEEGSPVTVNHPGDTPPARITAPCTTSGYWRVNMVGQVDDLGSTLVLKSGVAPFNMSNWMVPIYVAC